MRGWTVESSLQNALIEHLNAEIAVGSVVCWLLAPARFVLAQHILLDGWPQGDAAAAFTWLENSFMYIRIQRHPSHYGITIEPDRSPQQTADRRIKGAIS